MKRLAIIIILMLSVASFLTAQTPIDLDEMIGAFDDFSEEVANSLPFNSTIGLNWSDAYIGQFPNFGFGLTLGATTIPFEATDSITALMGVNLAESFPSVFTQFGFPFPAFTVDFRLGGFGIPFDMGFKLGLIPEDAQGTIQENLGMDIEYLLVGGDVRFALLQNKGFRPDLSVGGGVYYLNTSYTMPNLMGSGDYFQIADIGGYPVRMENPDLYLEMKCFTIDAKAQASWKILILQPYIGAGASYGRSETTGGLLTDGELQISDDGGSTWTNYIDTNDTIINAIEDELGSLNADGLTFGSEVNGWAFRAFGGIALKIAVIYIDLNMLYNFTSQSIGASANVRLQFNFHGRDRDEDENDE